MLHAGPKTKKTGIIRMRHFLKKSIIKDSILKNNCQFFHEHQVNGLISFPFPFRFFLINYASVMC